MEKYDYWLDSCPSIGDRTKYELLSAVGTSEELYKLGKASLQSILDEKKAEALLQHKEEFNLNREPEKLKEQGIQFISRSMPEFPARLRKIPDPPFALYVKGKLPEEERLSVAVIGARDCSDYGRYIAGELGKVLGQHGISLISGMARGIDGISQMAALEAGGVSFGVLGSGVDVCYPKSNRTLYEKLQKKGGIISTSVPGTLPRGALFPPRNRIVSGLSDVVVVIEARQRSGTSITVEMALEQGKDVYAVPGRVTDRLSDGCNRMLKDGAQIFLSPKEFVEELGMRYGQKLMVGKNNGDNTLQAVLSLSEEEQLVFSALDYYPEPLEKIMEKLERKKVSFSKDYSKVMITLMTLCIKGAAVQNSSGWFSKSI